jgi:hypothetical protein
MLLSNNSIWKQTLKKTRIIECGGQWLTTYAKWVLNATKKVAQNVLTMSIWIVNVFSNNDVNMSCDEKNFYMWLLKGIWFLIF